MSSSRSASLPSKYEITRRTGLTLPSASTCANSVFAERVSSAATTSASRNTRAARSDRSSRFPIGVPTINKVPSALTLVPRQRFDVDCRAHLVLEILLQAVEHPLFELPSAFAADVVAIADLLQRQRLVGEPALAEDRLLASFERLCERLELALEQLGELALRDRAIGTRRVFARQVVHARARAVVITAAHRRVERRFGRGEPALHFDDFFFGDVELLGEQRRGRLEA